MSLQYITHKGRKILCVDYTKCKTIDETLNVLEMVKNEYLKTTGELYVLNDFRDAYGSTEYMKRANEYAKEIFNQRTARNAAIGVTGIKKILLQAHNMLIKDKILPFASKEEALDYLAGN